MPLTFPSHAAAVLPFLHLPGLRRLPASALVVGSTAPDLIYLLRTHGAAAHLPGGLLLFCLPMGGLAFLYLEGLVLPVLGPLIQALLPTRWQGVGARILGGSSLPRGAREGLLVCLALVLGAATHQLWDSFTHAWMWPTRVLYPGVTVSLLGRPVLLSKVLQHLSTVVGAVVVGLYVAWGVSPVQVRAVAPQARADAARRLLRLVVLPALGAAAIAVVRLRHPHALLTRTIWDAAWSAVAGFALLLGVLCLLVRVRLHVRDARS